MHEKATCDTTTYSSFIQEILCSDWRTDFALLSLCTKILSDRRTETLRGTSDAEILQHDLPQPSASQALSPQLPSFA